MGQLINIREKLDLRNRRFDCTDCGAQFFSAPSATHDKNDCPICMTKKCAVMQKTVRAEHTLTNEIWQCACGCTDFIVTPGFLICSECEEKQVAS